MPKLCTLNKGALKTIYTDDPGKAFYKIITMNGSTATAAMILNSANTESNSSSTSTMNIMAHSYHPILGKVNVRKSFGHFGAKSSYVLFSSSALMDAIGGSWTASNTSDITYVTDTTKSLPYSAKFTNGAYFTRNTKFKFYQQPLELCVIFSSTTTPSTTYSLFSLFKSSTVRAHCALISGGYIEWWAKTSSTTLANFRTSITCDGTVHIAKIRFLNGTWHFYVDGTKVGTYDYTFPSDEYDICLGGNSIHGSYIKNIYFFEVVDGYTYAPDSTLSNTVTFINKTSFTSNIYNSGTTFMLCSGVVAPTYSSSKLVFSGDGKSIKSNPCFYLGGQDFQIDVTFTITENRDSSLLFAITMTPADFTSSNPRIRIETVSNTWKIVVLNTTISTSKTVTNGTTYAWTIKYTLTTNKISVTESTTGYSYSVSASSWATPRKVFLHVGDDGDVDFTLNKLVVTQYTG